MIVLVIYGLRLLELVIFIRVLLSWVSPDPRNRSLSWFTKPVDTILKPFQVVIPMGQAALDAGPLLALVLLQVLERVLIHFVI